jgi:hypothetical protein
LRCSRARAEPGGAQHTADTPLRGPGPHRVRNRGREELETQRLRGGWSLQRALQQLRARARPQPPGRGGANADARRAARRGGRCRQPPPRPVARPPRPPAHQPRRSALHDPPRSTLSLVTSSLQWLGSARRSCSHSRSRASCQRRRRCRSCRASRRSLRWSRLAATAGDAPICRVASRFPPAPRLPRPLLLALLLPIHCLRCGSSRARPRAGLCRKVQQGDRVTVHATGTVKETGKKFWSTKV